jgi:predicted metal-binding membrane protein
MWAALMVATMILSASPMILAFAEGYHSERVKNTLCLQNPLSRAADAVRNYRSFM